MLLATRPMLDLSTGTSLVRANVESKDQAFRSSLRNVARDETDARSFDKNFARASKSSIEGSSVSLPPPKFATLTVVGQTFGSVFIAEAGLLLIAAWQNGSSFERGLRSDAIVGATILAYTFFIYPVLGMLLGQRYPALPTFGAPAIL